MILFLVGHSCPVALWASSHFLHLSRLWMHPRGFAGLIPLLFAGLAVWEAVGPLWG